MSKQLHYCNKTVTSEQFQSGGTEGLQVTRADCSHRQNFERERVYVRIIPCKGLQISSNLPSSIKFNRTSNGYPCAIFFFSMKIRDALFAKRFEFVSGFFATLCLDGADSVSTTTIFTRILAELTSVIQTRRVRPL